MLLWMVPIRMSLIPSRHLCAMLRAEELVPVLPYLGKFMPRKTPLSLCKMNWEVPRGYIHSFISCHANDDTASFQNFHLFPIVSNLFHAALNTLRIGSTVAAQAIWDSFLVSQKVIQETVVEFPQTTTHCDATAPALTLPRSFPWKRNLEQDNAIIRSNCILCREKVMQNLKRAGVAKVSEVHAKFSTKMWDFSRTTKKSKGRIAYASMTPLGLATMSYSFMETIEIHRRLSRMSPFLPKTKLVKKQTSN